MPNIFRYSNLTNRGEYLESVPVPEGSYPDGFYLESPDVVALINGDVPRIYWIRDGVTVREMTAQEKTDLDAEIAAVFLAGNRSTAGAIKDMASAEGIQWRALALMLLDEFNDLRKRDRDRTADVAAATNLANLKTLWAARADLSDRTIAQVKTAYQNKIDAGSAD